MKFKKEDLWTLEICNLLKEELDNNKYELVCRERMPYSVSINNYSKNNNDINIIIYITKQQCKIPPS